MIYMDSSAIVKLIKVEAESPELRDWLNEQDTRPVTSVLVEVEVPCALRRSGPAHLAVMPGVLARISRIDIDASVRAIAAAYVDDALRSLDAIHLATAEVLLASGKTVSAFVTYDERQAAAVAATGIPVVSPGRS